MPIIKISPQSYEEFKSALKAVGRDPNEKGQIVIEKDDKLEPPFDVRTQAIRKDCLVEANKHVSGEAAIKYANMYFQYIFDGTMPNTVTEKAWK